jgi:hypothetical protein
MPLHGPLQGDLANFLEDSPDILFQALRPMRGSSSFVNYWRARQGDVFRDYLGGLGRQALSGVTPSGTQTQFLQNYPFLQRFNELGPSARGTQTSRFNPRVRFNV